MHATQKGGLDSAVWVPDSTLTTSELRTLRYALGRELHAELSSIAARGFDGIAIDDCASPGKLCDAFAANDGSSKYLRGALSTFGANQFSGADLATFCSAHKLPGQVLLRLESAGQSSRFSVVESGKCREVVLERRGSGEHAAESIACSALVSFGRWLATRFALASPPQVLGPVEATLRSSDAEIVHDFNRVIWEQVANVIRLPKIACGESFTFGKLAQLVARGDQGILSSFYGWYHPSYKVAVGVPRENVSDERIAEPDTVVFGAKGLLAQDPEARLSLATSGWANYWKAGQGDYFSVACAAREPNGLAISALRMTVDLSRSWPLERPRRELTRELGVSASLLLLCETLSVKRPELQSAARRLGELLASYGAITRADFKES